LRERRRSVPAIHETAYPRLKTSVTDKELHEIYTPTSEELAFAKRCARTPVARVGLLVLLKTFQRLGYFLLIAQVPHQILRHIATAAGLPTLPAGLDAYDATVIRKRQMPRIRKFLGVTAYGPAARRVMVKAAVEAARTKENLADIVNVVLEELI